MKEICLLYLERYANKDLEGVAELFADDIILRDWKIRVVGKEKALAETRKNFDAVDSLQISILHTHEDGKTVAAELKIIIDDKEELYVIDVISFNDMNQIESIRAYVGRGDD